MPISDRIAQIWRSIRHNPFFFVAMAALIVLLLWIFGCEPTTTSPLDPAVKLTRSQLKIEFETYMQRVELANEDLTRKEQLRDLLLNQAFIIAEGTTVNPFAMLTTAFSILGIGSVLDNRRKDRVIEKKSDALKNINAENT